MGGRGAEGSQVMTPAVAALPPGSSPGGEVRGLAEEQNDTEFLAQLNKEAEKCQAS